MWQLVFPAGEPIRWGSECVRCGDEATATLAMEASVGFEVPVVLGSLRKHVDIGAPACARCERWYRRLRKPTAVVAGLVTVASVLAAVSWLPHRSEVDVWYGLVILGTVGVFWGTLARALFDLLFCRTCVLLNPLHGARHVITLSPFVWRVLRPQVAALSVFHGLCARPTDVRIVGYGRRLRPKPPFEAWLERDGRALCLVRRTPRRTIGFRLQVVDGVDDIRPLAEPSMVKEVADLEETDDVGFWRVECDHCGTDWPHGRVLRTASADSILDHEWIGPEEARGFEGRVAIRTDVDA